MRIDKYKYDKDHASSYNIVHHAGTLQTINWYLQINKGSTKLTLILVLIHKKMGSNPIKTGLDR